MDLPREAGSSPSGFRLRDPSLGGEQRSDMPGIKTDNA